MDERINRIMDALALAFGGHSQYRIDDVGRALAGQMNNNGLPVEIEAAARAAAVFLAERFDWSPEDEDSSRTDIAASCRAQLDRLHVKYD